MFFKKYKERSKELEENLKIQMENNKNLNNLRKDANKENIKLQNKVKVLEEKLSKSKKTKKSDK